MSPLALWNVNTLLMIGGIVAVIVACAVWVRRRRRRQDRNGH